jgi:ankyrin repeat protein
MVETLLEHGAEVNQSNGNGTTPLMMACKKRSIELVRLLLRYNADPEIRNFGGEVALDFVRVAFKPDVPEITSMLSVERRTKTRRVS